MAEAQPHIIHKLHVQVSAEGKNQREGHEQLERISQWLHETFFPRLEAWFDAHFPPEKHLRVDRLQVRCSADGKLDWEVLQNALFQELDEAILSSPEVQLKEPINTQSSQLEDFAYYLQHGFLPWWALGSAKDLIIKVKDSLVQDPITTVNNWQQQYWSATAWKRLTYSLPNEWLSSLPQSHILYRHWEAFQQWQLLDGTKWPDWKFWATLSKLDLTTTASPARLLPAWLKHLQLQQVPSQLPANKKLKKILAQHFADLWSKLIWQQSTNKRQQILRELVAMLTKPNQLVKSLPDSQEAWIKMLSINLTKSPLATWEQVENIFGRLILSKEAVVVVKDTFRKQAKTETKTSTTTESKLAIQERLEEGIVIPNAGMILLHPLLSQFFQKLGLVLQDRKSWLDEQACARAINVLQAVLAGDANYAEDELVLHKLLLGYPLADPVPIIAATEEERKEGDALLRAVIGAWDKLGNSSPTALRDSFLLRQGILRQKANGWQLQIEKNTFDILLDSFPWGYHTLKTPWMEEVMFVEW